MNWIIYGVLGYLVYYYIKKNRLSPEQKELLRLANDNQINDEEIRQQFLNKDITLEDAIAFQVEQEKEKAEKAEKERDAVAKAEEELIAKLSSPNNRIYFCYSLVNTKSPLYLINPATNSILNSSATDLSDLYNEGWKLCDIDKTGQSAQLNDFNSVLQFRK